MPIKLKKQVRQMTLWASEDRIVPMKSADQADRTKLGNASEGKAVLPKRLARYSLELAEDKTKLIRFGRFASRDNQRLGEGAPSTFDFLGFTHYCGRSRAGKFKLKRRTATKKFRQKVAALKEWFRENLTTPITEVWPKLQSKLIGHYTYYNVNDTGCVNCASPVLRG